MNIQEFKITTLDGATINPKDVVDVIPVHSFNGMAQTHVARLWKGYKCWEKVNLFKILGDA